MAVSLQVSTAQRDTPNRILPPVFIKAALFVFLPPSPSFPSSRKISARTILMLPDVAVLRIKSDARLSNHEE